MKNYKCENSEPKENFPVFGVIEFNDSEEYHSKDDFLLDHPKESIIVYGMDFDQVFKNVIIELKKINPYMGNREAWEKCREDAIKRLETGRLNIVVGDYSLYIKIKNNYDYIEQESPTSIKRKI